MTFQQYPVRYDDHFSTYNATHEGLMLLREPDSGVAHLGGMIKGNSGAPLVANTPLVVAFVDSAATQSGVQATGVATVKVGNAWASGICLVDQGGAVSVQFPVGGVVQWCVLDITWLGAPDLP